LFASALREGHTIDIVELPEDVRLRLERTVDDLHQELEGQFDREQVSRLVHDSASRLAANSTVADNIPLLAYRFAPWARSESMRTSHLRGR
jgi:hypothetical protein